MTSFLRHAARSTGLTAADVRAAESGLGRHHRLTRSVSHQHTLARQSLVAVLVVLATSAGLALHLGATWLVVVVSAGVALTFVSAWVVMQRVARERAQELIAEGEDRVVVTALARERRRLSSRKERERLARSLEELHRDALRWYEIRPQFRPPYGVVQLRYAGRELERLTRALRRERFRVQGVALTSRFLTNGYDSPLYGNELAPLREELNRIRYLLEDDAGRHSDASAERRAA